MLGSTHIWLYLGTKFSRSLQGQEMTLNKNSLGKLSRSRKGNKAVGWFTPNGSSKTQIPIFVPIWSQCAKQAQSKLSYSKGLQMRLPKNFTRKPKRFSVPFTSPINLTRAISNQSSEPIAGLHLLKDHPGCLWFFFPLASKRNPLSHQIFQMTKQPQRKNTEVVWWVYVCLFTAFLLILSLVLPTHD